MKKNFLLLLPIFATCLAACGKGVHHKMSEYILETSFHDNYKILQLTDLHLSDKDDQDLHYQFLDLLIKEANADMIIVTGDLFTFASRSTAKRLFGFLDSYGKPWTVTFGNHDEQCYFSADWMTDYLNNFGSHCLFKDIHGDDVFGYSNFAINLKKGNDIFEQIIIMDSNRYNYSGYFGYDYFKQDQIDWYEELINYTTGQNGGTKVDSLMFYHIPLPEIDVAYETGLISGEKREKTCPPEYNSGFFEKIKTLGSTKAMFFGHDHVNNFLAEYEGVKFSYGMKSTDRVYFDEDLLGYQLITLHDDVNHTFDITRHFHTYEEVK